MSYLPGDIYCVEFTTSSPTTGAAADADTVPVAVATFAGGGAGSMILTVAYVDAGRYRVTGTIPAGRVRGDVLNVSVAATVGGVAGKAVVDTRVIGSLAGYSLAPTGLDAITPAPPVGRPATFSGWLMWLVRRLDSATQTADQIRVRDGDRGNAVVTTQAISDDGTTKTVGPAG